jgi:hypothetical protein
MMQENYQNGFANEFPEVEFNLGFCKNQIKSWKRWYMKKNSKYPANIQLRCHHLGIDPRFWKYYLELWINGEMKDQTLIKKEAYDTFDYDTTLKKEGFKNLEFITLHVFLPNVPAEDKTKVKSNQ